MSGAIAQATPSSEEEFHSPDEREDSWVFQKDIGVGGFGIVKLFLNETTGEKVVLKECRVTNLSQDFMERWYGELKIIKRLHHDNVVHALDVPVGLQYQPMGNVPFICMEYCDKGDLRQVLRNPENCCGLTEGQIRQICGDVNAGIRFLHCQRVIHRDLKPENILIKHIGGNKVVYKLTDFGYSKSYDQNSVCTSLVGTMQYVAPEVIKSRRYHSSVDFWSFGVVIFECITGRRPFLHGTPANNIAWIDFVAQKQPEDIHIYYSKDSTNPLFSRHIPNPHRLSKTFESLITSWLQTALQYNPEMRGGRRGSEEAPCLSNMDHILATKVMSTVCMSTGEEYFFKVKENTTYNVLNQQLPGTQQFQVLPTSHMPTGEDLVGLDMTGNLGRVYVFSTNLEPSFKLIHDSSEAVSTITAYGDSKLIPEEVREVYAQVFFHIRGYFTFFARLLEGHSAILQKLTQQCQDVQERQKQLGEQFLVVKEILGLVTKMYSDDCCTLSSLLQQDKVPQRLSEYHSSWQGSIPFFNQKDKDLQGIGDNMVKLREETRSYVRLADDLQTNYDSNYSRLEEYKQNYVAAARDLYTEVKSRRNFVKDRGMQDILLRATQEAQSFIVESLNGYNFGQTFITLQSHLQDLSMHMDAIARIKMDVMQMKDRLRESLWDIITESNSPLNSIYQATSSDSALVMNMDGAGGEAAQDLPDERGRPSAEELRRQFSSTSASSMDSVSDPKLVLSIHNLQRFVSEEENTRLIHKNKELRHKFQSLSRSTSAAESN